MGTGFRGLGYRPQYRVRLYPPFAFSILYEKYTLTRFKTQKMPLNRVEVMVSVLGRGYGITQVRRGHIYIYIHIAA